MILGALVYVGQFLFTTLPGLIITAIGIVAIVASVRASKRNRQEKLSSSLADSAQIMDNIVAGNIPELEVGLTLQKGEKLIYVMPVVALTEYQSTGSTYSGSSAGVSFPIVGGLRGNVGAHGGEVTKNPEQLMAVDQGRAIFTNQRIIFSGAKLVRDWDLDKIVELAPGPNGFNVKIAVSNRERTSGLQALSAYEFGPGYAAGYVFTLHDNGPAKAKEWAKDLSDRLRAGAKSISTPPAKSRSGNIESI